MNPANRFLRIKQQLFLVFLKIFDAFLGLVLLHLTWNTDRHWEVLTSFLLVLLMHCMVMYAERKKSPRCVKNAENVIIIMLFVSLMIFLTLPLVQLKSHNQNTKIPNARNASLANPVDNMTWTPCAIKTYENGLFDGFVFQFIFVFFIISIYIEYLRIENLRFEWCVYEQAGTVEPEAVTFV